MLGEGKQCIQDWEVFSGDWVTWRPFQSPGRCLQRVKAPKGLASASLPSPEWRRANCRAGEKWAWQILLRPPSPVPPVRASRPGAEMDAVSTRANAGSELLKHWPLAFDSPSNCWGSRKEIDTWKQRWQKAFPSNCSACGTGFWRIKKQTKLLLILSGLIKCFITFL